MRVMDSPPQDSSFPMSAHRHFGTSRTFWIFFWVLVVAAVIMGTYLLGIFGYLPSLFHRSAALPEDFSVVEGGGLHWYQLTGSKATEVPSSDAVVIKDSSVSVIQASAKLAAALTPVLARASATTGPIGTLMGVVNAKGAFTALVSDGSQKEGLTTAPNGAIAYAMFTPASTTSMSGLLGGLIFEQPNAGTWNIVLLTIQNHTPHIIGQGYDPRFLSNGSIMALGSEGVVILSPISSKRTVLIPQKHLLPGMYAVSDDLTHIVLMNPPSSFDVYSFNQSTLNVTKLRTLPIQPPVTFLPDGRLLNLTSSTTASVYNVTQLILSKTGTVTVQPISPSHAP